LKADLHHKIIIKREFPGAFIFFSTFRLNLLSLKIFHQKIKLLTLILKISLNLGYNLNEIIELNNGSLNYLKGMIYLPNRPELFLPHHIELRIELFFLDYVFANY
jgi:hypothetical protein